MIYPDRVATWDDEHEDGRRSQDRAAAEGGGRTPAGERAPHRADAPVHPRLPAALLMLGVVVLLVVISLLGALGQGG
ncbi:MAG: hypothetical protein MUE36_02410 [Acidimicrobiales bacterium]|jgi:hypothetical protein|nr:hypothetical protein [Acidimicrobiales bacterium]